MADFDAEDENTRLIAQGYTVRHVETWHREADESFIIWDAPWITEDEVPF